MWKFREIDEHSLEAHTVSLSHRGTGSEQAQERIPGFTDTWRKVSKSAARRDCLLTGLVKRTVKRRPRPLTGWSPGHGSRPTSQPCGLSCRASTGKPMAMF